MQHPLITTDPSIFPTLEDRASLQILLERDDAVLVPFSMAFWGSALSVKYVVA